MMLLFLYSMNIPYQCEYHHGCHVGINLIQVPHHAMDLLLGSVNYKRKIQKSLKGQTKDQLQLSMPIEG